MIRFGLVTFPVEAFNAHVAEGGHLPLHLLHAKCHSRIRYQKTCPIHGPVDNAEIVSAYEYGKGKYVEIDPDELEQLRTDEERTLTIDAFLPADAIDPIYLDGRMYYLSPLEKVAREPYAVFLEALQRQQRCGVGKVVFSGRQQVVLVRPHDNALQMAMLHYATEIRDPSSVVENPQIDGADKKVKLAEMLIAKWGDPDFDFTKYQNTYLEQERALIQAKAEGREVVAPQEQEQPHVINLMEALKQSVDRASRSDERTDVSAGRHPRKPHRGRRRKAS